MRRTGRKSHHDVRRIVVRSLGGGVILVLGGPAALASATFGDGGDGSAPGPYSAFGNWWENSCSPAQRYDTYTAEVGLSLYGTNDYNPPVSSPSTDYLPFIQAAYYEWSGFVGQHGVGAGSYFFMTGSGEAPAGTGAYQWGVDQANMAKSDYNSAQAASGYDFTNAFIMADIEIQPGNGAYFGWYYPAPAGSLALSANELAWDGFFTTLQNQGINVGVYSSPTIWGEIQGNSTVNQVEWTSEQDYGPATPCPTGDFINGPGNTSAKFFGGDSSSSTNALSWQWAESTDSPGDFDQFSISHYNALLGFNIQP